jgi:exopolysaccharide biosynthesis polyprenyl glycosylphosphotransferase
MILALDCICIMASLMLANYIRNGRIFRSDNEQMNFGMLLVASLTVFLAMNLLRNMNRNMFLRGPLHEMIHIIRNNVLMFGGTAVFLYFLNILDAYSRLAFFYFLVIDCGLMLAVHQLWKKLLPVLYKRFGETRKLLAVADEEYSAALVEDLKNMKDFSYEVTGIILLDRGEDSGEDYEGIPVPAGRDGLVDYCKGASLDEVIIAVGSRRKKEILADMEILAEMGITLHYQIPVPELSGARQKELSQFGRFYTVTYANRVAPVGQILLKRLLDICGALVGCVVLLVLTIIVGPLIKLESPGPVFFSQKRVGRNGRIFNMYKFRSMYADAEERKQELMQQNEMNGLMFKIENDPRITKIGRFMRRTSLDEFPQFINILKSDMSLVGTRPPTLDEFAQYSPYHKKRLSFRPGLTGMWQVGGRSEITDFEEIVRLDVEYIDNWSFMLDVKILLKTVLEVFRGSGAK